ncbi:VOC family protein [Pinibacter soli]|uniref:VOC family protein n=1 Tax=Pinibacter soli TaxID=3044211 RepID=A0ABT6R831_9BACT|nr:VOC family protein [Pinibacter soli]MDI3318561.1 VOC family protein [Pinibacter soli]
MNIPTGQQAVMPYLILKNAHRFIEFTKHVFDAEKTLEVHRDDGITITHAQISISGSTIMFAESSDEYPTQNANLFVYVDDADATYEKALSFNATSLMAPDDQPYGRSCGVKDPFGNTWWITSV